MDIFNDYTSNNTYEKQQEWNDSSVLLLYRKLLNYFSLVLYKNDRTYYSSLKRTLPSMHVLHNYHFVQWISVQLKHPIHLSNIKNLSLGKQK